MAFLISGPASISTQAAQADDPEDIWGGKAKNLKSFGDALCKELKKTS